MALSDSITWSQTTRDGKRVPSRNLRDDGVVSPLRMRVETPDGVLVVYDAASPPGVELGCSGFLVYYSSKEDQSRYVFGGIVETQAELAEVLLQLADELDVDLEALSDADERIEEALSLLPPDSPDRGNRSRRIRSDKSDDDRTRPVWEPATVENAAQIMGFDPVQLPDAEGVEGTVALECGPCYASLPAPRICGSPLGLFAEASRVASGCCGGGGGGGGGPPPPPNPCNPPPANDLDCDGIPNSSDGDVDGDGLTNGNDPDVDGDGTPNGSDPDVDGDGIPNGSDGDVNNDGITNGGDSDIDGDGLTNGQDPDPDGDGTPNAGDGDDDGNGSPDPVDPEPGGCTSDCPGACCTKASGACASKKQADCTGDAKYFKGKEVPCTPNPCCVFGTNPAFDIDDAVISKVAPSWPWTYGLWGQTATERMDVSISATCDGDHWCAVLDVLVGNYSMEYRLLPGIEEVTGPGGNTTQSNYCSQVDDLVLFASWNGPPLMHWYRLLAIWAHEMVHVGHLEPALDASAPAIESQIESVCIPHVPGKTRTQVIADLRASSGFVAARNFSLRRWSDVFQPLADADHGVVFGGGPAYDAETTENQPMANRICAHADAQCWEFCSSCAERTTRACCAGGGTGLCSVKSRCDCQADGGTYQGDDSVNACGPPNPCQGACCLSETLCNEMTQTRCQGFKGRYFGDGTTCAITDCGPPG